jgi:hypothetical protein
VAKKSTKVKSASEDNPKKLEKPIYDDDVDDLVSLMEGHSTGAIYKDTWLSRGTISKLRHPDWSKRTKKPQHMTMRGVASALGYEYRLVRRIKER